MELSVESAPRHPAPRRHDPRLLADQPLQGRRRPRAGEGHAGRARHRCPGRHRRGGHARRGRTAWPTRGWRSSACPKTIDNDLSATELTFGFDTAVQICVDAIDRLHTTAECHDRVMVVEVMGRHAGHIAAVGGHRRRGHDDADPRAALRHRGGVRGHPAPARARASAGRRSWWSPRARTPKEGTMELQSRRRSTPSATCGSAASATRLAEPIEARTGYETRVDRARARAARRHAHRVRPGAGDPLRRRCHRRRPRRGVRHDGGPAGRRHRPGAARRRQSASSSSSTPRSTTWPRCSSAESPRVAVGQEALVVVGAGDGTLRSAPESACTSLGLAVDQEAHGADTPSSAVGRAHDLRERGPLGSTLDVEDLARVRSTTSGPSSSARAAMPARVSCGDQVGDAAGLFLGVGGGPQQRFEHCRRVRARRRAAGRHAPVDGDQARVLG